MNNRELITGYRDIVFEIHGLRQQLAWNHRHDLPALNMPEKIDQLSRELIRFEDLLNSIEDLRARNIICMRYVLGMTERDTAFIMNLSRVTVNRICSVTLQDIDRQPGLASPPGG